MVEILAGGVLAAVLAWVLNGALLKAWDTPAAVIYAVPILEEALKTGLALWLGAAVFGVHFCFGALEAVLDWRGSH